MTLLHAVRFSPARLLACGRSKKGHRHLPVLPALKEIKITVVLELFLILVRLASRLSFVMLPSSNETPSARTETNRKIILTSDV
jgi:hypothetical protein